MCHVPKIRGLINPIFLEWYNLEEFFIKKKEWGKWIKQSIPIAKKMQLSKETHLMKNGEINL